MRLKERQWTQITTQGCPDFLDLDESGKYLLVSYQCGGPTGRDGHEAVEVIDTATDRAVVTYSGAPLVGGEHRFFPGGELIWLDGWDACVTEKYPRIGCPSPPGRIHHILRWRDRTVVQTLSVDRHDGGRPLILPDGKRVVLQAASAIGVFETGRVTQLEKLKMGGPVWAPAALAPNGRKAYVAQIDPPALLVFEAEGDRCSDPGIGVIHVFSGDGVGSDSRGYGVVTGTPPPRYARGRIGQAFEINGQDKLEIETSTTSGFGREPSTLSLFLKDSSEQVYPGTILEDSWPVVKRGWWRLGLDGQRRLGFAYFQEGMSAPIEVAAPEAKKPGTWKQIAVTKTDARIVLYLDGEQVAEATSVASGAVGQPRYRLGWSESTSPKQGFRGLVDEIVMWNRELSAAEVRERYRKRLSTGCAVAAP